jgi:hypothetical protein
MLRSYLYEAANVLLTRIAKWSARIFMESLTPGPELENGQEPNQPSLSASRVRNGALHAERIRATCAREAVQGLKSPLLRGPRRLSQDNGFAVEIILTVDLLAKLAEARVPSELNGCHLIEMSGYVVIGHVPIEPIRKLLAERPKIIGISIPGMPVGLPGMEGPRSGSIAVYEIVPEAGRARVFMNV